MKKIHNKLVRDKIPYILEDKGISVEYKKLSNEEITQHLKLKIKEETQELNSANGDQILGELCDVLEVLMSIAKHNNIEWKQVEEYRKTKEAERGSFNDHIFLISTEE